MFKSKLETCCFDKVTLFRRSVAASFDNLVQFVLLSRWMMYLGYIYQILLTSADNFSRNSLKRAKKAIFDLFLTFFDHFYVWFGWICSILQINDVLGYIYRILLTSADNFSRNSLKRAKKGIFDQFLTIFWPFCAFFGIIKYPLTL